MSNASKDEDKIQKASGSKEEKSTKDKPKGGVTINPKKRDKQGYLSKPHSIVSKTKKDRL